MKSVYFENYGDVQTHKQPTRVIKAAMRTVAQERGWSYDASRAAASGVRIAKRTPDGWLAVIAAVERRRGRPSEVSVAGGVRLDRVAHVGNWPGDKDEPPVVEWQLNTYRYRGGYLTNDEQLFVLDSPALLVPLLDEIRVKADYAESMADSKNVVDDMLGDLLRMRGGGRMDFPALEILVAGNPVWEEKFQQIQEDQVYAETNADAHPDVIYQCSGQA